MNSPVRFFFNGRVRGAGGKVETKRSERGGGNLLMEHGGKNDVSLSQ